MRLPALSQRALSWTDVRFTLNGVNATDPYQPGRMIVFPDMQAVQDVVVRQGLDISVSPAYGSEIAILLRDPGHGWHGNVSSSGTGSFLASGNLPSAATRGSVLQTEQFNWFTRDHAEIFAPLGARADALLAITGQWASQSVPDAAPGQNLNSRLLFSNAWGRYQIDKNNQIHAAFSGSQIHLSNWGVPAGIGPAPEPMFSTPPRPRFTIAGTRAVVSCATARTFVRNMFRTRVQSAWSARA